MYRFFISTLFLACFFFPTVFAWGPIGHNMTAYVAYNQIHNNTRMVLHKNYNITTADDFASVANWADIVKDMPEYRWSYDLHFIDIQSPPLTRCLFEPEIDCANGQCVYRAIYNYTKILQKDPYNWEALKFLVHFMGDIFQPFHVGYALDIGGNTIHLSYSFDDKCSRVHSKAETNLHAIWDSAIIEQRVKELGGKPAFLDELLVLNSKSKFDPEWTTGDFANSSIGTICYENLYFENGTQITNGTHLDRGYYARMLPIVEQRLIASGYYMSFVLDSLFISFIPF
jgi:hypothetical protein